MRPALVLAGLGAAAAFRIAAELPDGLYSARPGAGPLDPPPAALARRTYPGAAHDVSGGNLRSRFRLLSEYVPVPKGSTFCRAPSDAPNITAHDLLAAVNALFETPLFWIPPRSAVFALHGSAIAYICTFADWNTGSLVEFMDAMDYLDTRCGPRVPAKLTLPDWAKFYGREARQNDICQWEFDHGGIQTGILADVRNQCHHYVSGISRWLGSPGRCNDNAGGPSFWRAIKAAFPWYQLPSERLADATATDD